MKNELTMDNVLHIYEKEISKNVKNKKKLYDFELNKFQNITNIIDMLNVGNIGHKHYNIFLIYEPKQRLVMSLNIKDKIINHFITRYVLESNLEKYLDIRNAATRKGMGTDYAIKLVKKYINELKCKNSDFYILKIDIKKYFYSIDHKVLKGLLIDKLSPYDYNLVEKIIDSTNDTYINNVITSIMEKKKINLPLYETGKGLPIGNMTSQFLSIYYLYKLDHYIVHDLKLKYYVRYMDDFIIMDENLDKLKNAQKKIREILDNEFKLKISENKTLITNIKNGFSFLGYVFKVVDKKTIVKIKKSNYEKITKRVKMLNKLYKEEKINIGKCFCTIMTYQNCYKYAYNGKVMRIIDKYWFNEK